MEKKKGQKRNLQKKHREPEQNKKRNPAAKSVRGINRERESGTVGEADRGLGNKSNNKE